MWVLAERCRAKAVHAFHPTHSNACTTAPTAGVGVASASVTDVDASTQALTLTFTGGALTPVTVQLPKGGSGAPAGAPLQPAPATVLYLASAWIASWNNGNEPNYRGQIGGRKGADDRCRLSAVKPAGYNYQYRAVLSINATDTVANFATNYGLNTGAHGAVHVGMHAHDCAYDCMPCASHKNRCCTASHKQGFLAPCLPNMDCW